MRGEDQIDSFSGLQNAISGLLAHPSSFFNSRIDRLRMFGSSWQATLDCMVSLILNEAGANISNW
jgi:hypothetical protein